MAALTSQERPGAANAVAVIRPAVRMLAVAVLVVPMIGDAGRHLDLEHGLGDLERVEYPRIAGRAQPEPDKVEIFHADELDRGHALAPSVGHVHASAQAALHGRRPDAPVIALCPERLGKRSSRDIGPVLYPLVPAVGKREDELAFLALEEFGRRNKRDDLDPQRERADAGILFPAVLRADGAV